MTNPLKIGFSVAYASEVAGGISEVLKGLGRAIVARNINLRVFAGEDEHIRFGTDCWEGLEISISRVFGPRFFGFQADLHTAVVAWKPSSMHVHGLWMYPSWATRYWRRLGIPYVVAPHGMIDRWALSHSAHKKRLALVAFERFSLENAACLHALTNHELESIRAFGLTNPVALIPNGIDLPPQCSAIGGTGRKVILFLGRLHPKKGIAELLYAWEIAKAHQITSAWRLVIAGWDDGYGEDLVRLRDVLGLAGDVEFLGPVFGDNKARAFNGADAFILPSKSEGLPMAVLEAWSYGLPVLMTKECNLVEGFGADAALRVTCDPPTLARELVQFFARSETDCRKIGANGRALVEQIYRWEAVADQLITIHYWITGHTGKPDFVDTVS